MLAMVGISFFMRGMRELIWLEALMNLIVLLVIVFSLRGVNEKYRYLWRYVVSAIVITWLYREFIAEPLDIFKLI